MNLTRNILAGLHGRLDIKVLRKGRLGYDPLTDADHLDARAAVVALLRETLATSETAYASDDLDYAIDIIERGEHRREEE